jgi:hypothetical protein
MVSRGTDIFRLQAHYYNMLRKRDIIENLERNDV